MLTLGNERAWTWFQIHTHNTDQTGCVTLRNAHSPSSVSPAPVVIYVSRLGLELNVIKKEKKKGGNSM